MQPIGIAGQALEEPRGYACHPNLVVGVAGISKGFIDGLFLVGGERGMDPGEGACAAVGQ